MGVVEKRTAGPLDPDPFGSEHARGGSVPVLPVTYLRRFGPRLRSYQALDIASASVALVAYIPPHALKGIYAAFSDDGVTDQPEWLSEVFLSNHYRLAAGLRLDATLNHWFVLPPGDAVVFAKANPTTIRGIAFPRFPAPIDYAPPRLIVPPPLSHSDELVVSAVNIRSKNGFLATKIGVAAARLRGVTSERIPQIGSSMQIWIAEDGCKCIAAAHNYFPSYELYIEGVRCRWDEEKDFEKFNAYDLPVDWKMFLAVRMHDALRPFPLVQRYPGACLSGWYKSIDENGTFEWCEARAVAVHMKYSPPRSSEQIVKWWEQLDLFVQRYRQLDHQVARDENLQERNAKIGTDERLSQMWETITAGVTVRRHSIAT